MAILINLDKGEERDVTSRKSEKIILVSGLLLIIFMAAGVYYTSQPGFCSSCHIMEPIYQSWTNSVHKEVECYACHAGPGVSGIARAKISGIRELAITVLNLEANPQAQVNNERCQKCHQSWGAELKTMPGIVFNHQRHMEGKNCTLCHSGVGHGQQARLFMKDCLACHKNKGQGKAPVDECLQCHKDAKSIKPQSHQDPNWTVTHGQELLKNKNECLKCHKQNTNLSLSAILLHCKIVPKGVWENESQSE